MTPHPVASPPLNEPLAAQGCDTLILGIGNNLLGDEGVGVQLLWQLQQSQAQHPELENTRLLDGGTLSFTLAQEIADHPMLIVVDAARTGNPPGTVSCFEGADMERHLSSACGSVHEVGLQDLLDISRLSDAFPRRLALIGIEPQSLDWGEQLSPPVARALPLATQKIIALLRSWRAAGASDPVA